MSDESSNKRPLEEPADVSQTKERKVEVEQDKPREGPDFSLEAVIFGLPKYMDKKQLAKLLTSNSIAFKNAKKVHNQEFAFIYFESLEQKQESVNKIKGMEVKGTKLTIQDRKGKSGANKNNNNNNNNNNNRHKNKDSGNPGSDSTDASAAEPPNVNKSTAPMWNVPYQEQLKKKAEHANNIIYKVVRQIKTDSKHHMLDWLKKTSTFPFEGVRPAPLTNKYRNKVQFTIGFDSSGAPCIGFVVGKFLAGQSVMSPEGAVTVPELATTVRNAFQEYVEKSSYAPYEQKTHVGFWRLLTVKAFTRTNEVMAIIQVKSEGIPAADLELEKKKLAEFIEAKKATGLVISSVMMQEYSGVSSGSPVEIPCSTVWGASHVHEKLLNQTFRISPHAFFQTNTIAAEIIYNIVRQWCSPTGDSILLDLCCGTGTIGQCIAGSVKEVLGIEMSEEAVEDAKINAELNGHKNIKYIAGKVEDVLEKSFSSLPAGPIIAVVDPPRPGLHKSVLTAIRANSFIKRLVYVSCEPSSLISNCSMLCRTQSKTAKGAPFRPINSVGVDMFPHTEKLEMIVLFERMEDDSTPQNTEVKKVEAITLSENPTTQTETDVMTSGTSTSTSESLMFLTFQK